MRFKRFLKGPLNRVRGISDRLRIKPRSAAGLNILEDNGVLCNFCSGVFPRSGPVHSEFLQCPFCQSIARERLVYQCILDEVGRRTENRPFFIRGAKVLRDRALLECSPRMSPLKRRVYEETLGTYLGSDLDQSAHQADVRLDLTREEEVDPYRGVFDIIICSHVLEHIPDYRAAIRNLREMLRPSGFVLIQVPLLEGRYTPVHWDEFHGDQTRVYHRFGFDLLFELETFFSRVQAVVGLLDFEITSPEIAPDKYAPLAGAADRCIIQGEYRVRLFGLGNPDLCDAFVAHK